MQITGFLYSHLAEGNNEMLLRAAEAGSKPHRGDVSTSWPGSNAQPK